MIFTGIGGLISMKWSGITRKSQMLSLSHAIDFFWSPPSSVAVVSNKTASGLKAYNEGLSSPGQGGAFIFELPYWVLLPSARQAVNLLLPSWFRLPQISLLFYNSYRHVVFPRRYTVGNACCVCRHP